VIVIADGLDDAGDTTELERRFTSDPAWHLGEISLVARASEALAPASVRVWERIHPSSVKAAR
jgi:hypothetical protein